MTINDNYERLVLGKSGKHIIAVDSLLTQYIKWVAVDSDGNMYGYEEEPELLPKRNLWSCTGQFFFLGTVVFEDDEDWRDCKWEALHVTTI